MLQLGQRHYKQCNISNLYDVVFWEVSLTDLVEPDELRRTDIWGQGDVQGAKRDPYRNNSAHLDQIQNTPLAIQQNIIETVSKEHLFQSRWMGSIDQYHAKAYTISSIYRDKPGFSMGVHLDNNRIATQMIVNLEDNDTGTELYSVGSDKPFYVMSGTKNTGIMFVNSPGALHCIKNVNKDRYILYSAVSFVGF